MKKIIKKLISCVVALAMSLTITNSMVSCEQVPPYECGDFTYRLCLPKYCKNQIEEEHAAIIGLTEVGKSKEILIVPDEVDEYIVGHVGQYAYLGTNGSIDSEKLVRFYATDKNILDIDHFFNGAKTEDGSFPNPNLEKVVIKFQETSKDGYNGKVYSRKASSQGWKDWKGYNYTNVSYWLNYESENLGLYWVDDFDYGTAITYIPENPTREGYIFDGWYKEPECINEWDFETDTLPQAKYNEQEEEIHQETKLYVKWIEN